MTAILLLPLLGGLWYAANDALQHKSATDWRANHETKVSLEHAAMLVVGAPSLGALLAGTGAALLGRRAAVSAAAGALLGTVALWIAGIVAVFIALENVTLEF